MTADRMLTRFAQGRGGSASRWHFRIRHSSSGCCCTFRTSRPAAQGGSNKAIIDKLQRANSAFGDYGDDNRAHQPRTIRSLDRGLGGSVWPWRGPEGLSGNFTSQTPSNRDPSTDVHLLIESLGIVPGSAL